MRVSYMIVCWLGLPEMYHETGIALGEVDGGRVEIWTFVGCERDNTCCKSHRALGECQLLTICDRGKQTYGDISCEPGGHLEGHVSLRSSFNESVILIRERSVHEFE
jgi:hypothetical protein